MIKGVEVVTICGSTRFTEQMLIKQWELTKQGKVVMSWCALPESYWKEHGFAAGSHHIGDQENVKEIVDEVHKRKIDISDRIHVMNIGGYIGKSTASEIAYAKSQNKAVTYEEEM